MGTGPWSEITEFPDPELEVVERPNADDPGPGAEVMINLRSPRWWLLEWHTAVRVWTRASGKWKTIAWFKDSTAAFNYAEALAYGIAEQHNGRVREGGE